MALITSHPGKFLWTTFALILGLIKAPIISLVFLFKRPHPQWTVRQTVMSHYMRSFLYHSAAVEVKTPLRLEPGSEGERFERIPPASPKYYVGILADKEIKPTPTGGTWYPSVPVDRNAAKVLLHFHGGGYAIGEGRPGDAGYAASILTKTVLPYVLMVQYRLASNPQGRFPTALQDAVTSYRYLLDQGYRQENIVISGDSAGGHIAIGLIRYLSLDNLAIPAPRAALLWSPALDLISARNPDSIDRNKFRQTDYLVGNFTSWGAKSLLDGVNLANAMTQAYVNHLKEPFLAKVPLWLSFGDAEIFQEEGLRFKKAMDAIPGNKIAVHMIPNAPHDVLFVGNILGFEKAAEDAGASARDFISTVSDP